jgi:hypothetical protein
VFYLTGTDVGQNSDIGIFVDNCKNTFANLVGQLIIYEDTKDKGSAREAIGELVAMAKTVDAQNGKGAAGQKNTF